MPGKKRKSGKQGKHTFTKRGKTRTQSAGIIPAVNPFAMDGGYFDPDAGKPVQPSGGGGGGG